jgi:cardiolipin synthase
MENRLHAEIQLLESGATFFDALEKYIDEAEEEIQFQTYIVEADETGLRITRALERAAQRGVKVFLMLDAFASANLRKKYWSEIKSKGIEIKFYGPLIRGSQFHIGRRFHRKVIVFDNRLAIVGGINISNNYNQRKWLDFAVVVGGETAKKLRNICMQRWTKKTFRKFPKEFKRKKESSATHTRIRIRQNDYLRRLNEVAATYKREVKHAQHSLMIVGGYFLPGGIMRRTLRRAVQRGVEVKVILARESDSKIARFSIQYLYQWFLRNGIAIYEYLPANVHGKILIADKKFVTIGSYDLNNLSTFSNIELNLDILDEKFATDFHIHLEKIIEQDCQLVTKEDLYSRTNLWRRFKYWFAYQFSKTLFGLGYWLAKRDDEESYQ